MESKHIMSLLELGTCGYEHLLRAAQKSFQLAEHAESRDEAQDLLGMAGRLLCMAWSEFYLNPSLAGQLYALSETTPALKESLTPEARELAKRISRMTDAEDRGRSAASFFDRGRIDALKTYLDAEAAKGKPLVMAKHAFMYLGVLSEWDWLDGFVARHLSSDEPDIARLLHAEIFLAQGAMDRAIPLLESLHAQYALPGTLLHLANAYGCVGERDKAKQILARIVNETPWHTSALLLLEHFAFPTGGANTNLKGKCAICIYSYNKAAELRQTLSSLLASRLDGIFDDIAVKVLVNGSEDESLQIAESASALHHKVEVISLPVNIGAPAARNWLIKSAEREQAEWIVFLDDDALVPEDWLSGLASGVERYPDAGVWGCRVMDASSPSLVQHGDAFLIPPDPKGPAQAELSFYMPSAESFTPSLFSYRRYSATVTGCCHMFRTQILADNKGFDLSFSPSQYDDLDMDLRLLENGTPAAYLGDIAIKHLRVSPRIQKPSKPALLNSESHKRLLERKRAPQYERLIQQQNAMVRADLDDKRQRLHEAGFLQTSSE